MTGLLEGGFLYCDITACVTHHATTVMQVWKQWAKENWAHKNPLVDHEL